MRRSRVLTIAVIFSLCSLCMTAAIPDVAAAASDSNYTRYPTAHGPDRVTPADIDGDGDEDIILTCSGKYKEETDNWVFMINDGSGHFTMRIDDFPDEPWSFSITDMDGDSDPDIIVHEEYGISLLVNDGAGNFEREPVSDLESMYYGEVQAGDLNGDGRMDIAFNDKMCRLQLYFAMGEGVYEHQELRIPPTTSWTLNDLDGDGDLDLFCVTLGIDSGNMFEERVRVESYVNVRLNPGNGSFENTTLESLGYVGFSSVIHTQGSGSLRFYVVDDDDEAIEVYQWESQSWSGLGGIPLIGGDPGDTRHMSLGDVTGDGKNEILLLATEYRYDLGIEPEETWIHVYSDSPGSVDRIWYLETTLETTEIAVIDADMDGKPDLVGCEGWSWFMMPGDVVWVALQNSDGTFPDMAPEEPPPLTLSGEVAGVIVVVVLLAIIIPVVVLLVSRRSRKKDDEGDREGSAHPPPPHHGYYPYGYNLFRIFSPLQNSSQPLLSP